MKATNKDVSLLASADSESPPLELESKSNIRLLIAYDGTDFCGWQRQEAREGPSKKRTVQGEIEKALAKIHKHPVRLTGSGRTDSGVHAGGQSANFYTSLVNMEADRFVPALNNLLPRDVRILKSFKARPDFNARFDARSRTYRYYFIHGRAAMPWELRYACQLWHRPSVTRLNALASALRGDLDCTVFAAPGDKSLSRNRYIFGASFFIEGDKLVFEISANAFLWKMVRFAAGTLIRLDEKGAPPSRLKEIIESRDRSLAGPTAPPNGLFLWKIDYYKGAL